MSLLRCKSDARQRAKEQDQNKLKNVKCACCLIVFVGLVFVRLYGCICKTIRKNRMIQIPALFLELSLGVSHRLENMIYTRDRSKGAGSEARGEGRERGYL